MAPPWHDNMFLFCVLFCVEVVNLWSPLRAPGWKGWAGASKFKPILAKFSPKNVGPQLFIFWSLFTYFRILILNSPWSQRISSKGTPLESIFAIGWAQVVSTTEAYWEPFLAWRLRTGFHSTVSSCKARHFWRLYGEHWNFERCILGGCMRMGLQNWFISRLCCILGRWYRMGWLTCVV